MSKLAANAGLDTSNVPQLPVPQLPTQQQVGPGARAHARASLNRVPAALTCCRSPACWHAVAARQGRSASSCACQVGPDPHAWRHGFSPAAPPLQVPSGLALEQGMLGPASPIPTQCLLLKNMFDPAE